MLLKTDKVYNNIAFINCSHYGNDTILYKKPNMRNQDTDGQNIAKHHAGRNIH